MGAQKRSTAARGQTAARDEAEGPSGVGVLTGGRLTLEDAYAYAKFTRLALNTNDIDMRARPHSAEEEQFLAARVAGRRFYFMARDSDCHVVERPARLLMARDAARKRLPAPHDHIAVLRVQFDHSRLPPGLLARDDRRPAPTERV